MNTVKILVHKELATTFNSWSIYIGYTLFFCVCGFFSWLSSNNLLYIGQANMMQIFGTSIMHLKQKAMKMVSTPIVKTLPTNAVLFGLIIIFVTFLGVQAMIWRIS